MRANWIDEDFFWGDVMEKYWFLRLYLKVYIKEVQKFYKLKLDTFKAILQFWGYVLSFG